jgi:hypothetical protein
MLDPKASISGGRRYSFVVAGRSNQNLFQRCFTRDGRHDYVLKGKIPGPNVFLDCVATEANNDTRSTPVVVDRHALR